MAPAARRGENARMKRLRPALLGSLLALSCIPAAWAQDVSTLDRQALDAYRAKDFGRSADLFARALAAAPEDEAGRLYNAACATALAGRSGASIGLLQRAAEAGFQDADTMAKDSDLASLHADPRWSSLLARVRQNQARVQLQWKSPAIATPWREQISEDERLAGLSRLWSEAKFNFVNFDKVPELDWDALYVATIPKVRAAGNTLEYYRVLAAFVAQLQDGHSNVWPALDHLDQAWARPGVETRLVEGRVFVTAVHDPRIEAMGVARGWELVGVRGEPVRAFAEREVLPYQSASTPHDRLSRTYERALLAGPIDETIAVDFHDGRGRPRTLELPRSSVTTPPAAGAPPAFAWELLPGNIAWVRLRSFGDDSAASAFEAAFEEISRADGLVLDVRENGGGNSDVGYRILSTLTDKPFLSTAWSTRSYRPSFRAWGQPEARYRSEPDARPPSGVRLYRKPVVVLTSPRTYSAAEDFTVAFDVMDRGRIIGEPTGGSTGQPLLFPLPGGGTGRVCTKRDVYPDGREFVGVGVQPDLRVAQTLADLGAGRDTVLETAAALLRDRRDTTSAN